MRWFAVFAVAAALGGSARAAEQKESGFALELRLTSHITYIGTFGQNSLALPGIQGGFAAGYKYGRILVGLSFDFQRVATDQSTQVPGTPTMDKTTSATSFLIGPTVQFAALRSSDGRVDLFGELDLGFGTTVMDQTPPPNPNPSTSNWRIAYAIGPGLRLWLAPQFAIAGFVGVSGEFSSTTQTINVGTTITTTQSSGVTAIVGSLRLLGVF